MKNYDAQTRKNDGSQLYYVNGTPDMLHATATDRDSDYLWSEQSKGVGHFAKYAHQRLSESDPGNILVQLALENSAKTGKPIDRWTIDNVSKEIQQDADMQDARRVYDSPSKGVLWGWEVPAYVWTKAIATGTFLMMAIWYFLNGGIDASSELNGLITTLVFMGLTAAFLVKDLDRPDRFIYVLLRPQWKSWLVRGAYIITGFSGLVSLKLLDNYLQLGLDWLWIPGMIFAGLGAVYTAFLFNQARARDLWQTPIQSAIHMLVHAFIAGSVMMIIIAPETMEWMTNALLWGVVLNMVIIAKEILMPHKTLDTRKAIQLMTKGYYSKYFWAGIIVGSVVPIMMLTMIAGSSALLAGGLSLVGILLTEFVCIRVPQMIPLS
jgi:hypothetical protein